MSGGERREENLSDKVGNIQKNQSWRGRGGKFLRRTREMWTRELLEKGKGKAKWRENRSKETSNKIMCQSQRQNIIHQSVYLTLNLHTMVTLQHNNKNKNVVPKMRSQYHSCDRDNLAYYFIIFT